MDKSPEAFRTISEVAETLETPAHVLRFWESRFPQIKPVKRAGGRRYYRPADVALLSGIRHLLHDEGMTIRGVQKILREQGVRHVASMAAGSEAVDFDAEVDGDDLDAAFDDIEDAIEAPEPAPVQARVVALDPVSRPPSPAPVVPSAPAEVVQLRAAPAGEPEGIPMSAFGTLPPQAPPEEVPEAGHIWVDDEPEMELATPAPLFPMAEEPIAAPIFSAEPESVAEVPAEVTFMDEAPQPVGPKLSGIAARIRALPRALPAETVDELLELHSRLGLLQAQMAEALRLRK